MAVLEVSDLVYRWLSAVSVFVSLPLAVVLLCLHIAHSRKRKLQCNAPLFFSFLLMVLATSMIITTGLNIFATPTTTHACNVSIITGFTIYQCEKWSLYMQISFRLGKIFRKSAYSLSWQFEYIWRAFLTIAVIAVETGYLLQSKQVVFDEESEYFPCAGHYSTSIPLAITGVDTVACVTMLIQFIWRLRRLSSMLAALEAEQTLTTLTDRRKSQTSSNATNSSKVLTNLTTSKNGSRSAWSEANETKHLMTIAKKYTILTFAGVATTMTAAIMVAVFGIASVVVPLDCLCNTVVVFLMFRWNEDLVADNRKVTDDSTKENSEKTAGQNQSD